MIKSYNVSIVHFHYFSNYLFTRCTESFITNSGRDMCICPKGFALENGTFCLDIDECRHGSSVCTYRCINNIGGYECECSEGELSVLTNL